MIRDKLLFLLFLLSPALLLSAQTKEVRFRHLTIEEGLSQSTVTGIVQDTTGYIWIGTHDGLNRYDGYNFKIYRNSPRDSNSICANHVSCLLLDKNGRIWIGTAGGGLDMFDETKEVFRHYLKEEVVPKKIPINFINTVFEDKEGRLWVGTQGGLVLLNTETGAYKMYRANYTDSTTLTDNKITAIAEDNNGILWIGTAEDGICTFNASTAKCHRFPWQIYPPYKTGVMVGKDITKVLFFKGKIWTSNPVGLNIFDPATGEVMYKRPLPGDVTDSNVVFQNNLYIDRHGRVWLSFFEQGFGKLDLNSWRCPVYSNVPSDPTSLHLNSVNCMLYDNADNLWLGLNGAGVDFLSSNLKFDHYKLGASGTIQPGANSIRAIIRDRYDNIYVGGYGGLFMADSLGKVIKKFSSDLRDPAHNLLSNAVYALCEDVDGKIWIGYEGVGLQLYDPATGKFKHWIVTGPGRDQIPDLMVSKIFRDSSNNIWIGTRKGLVRYDRENDAMVHYYDKLNGEAHTYYIRDIKDDGKDALWLATDDGLVHMNKETGKCKLFSHDRNDVNTIGTNRLTSVYKDKDGVLWVTGEGSGVDCIRLKPITEPGIASIQHFTTQEGLPSNVTYGILEDKRGYLWVSTNNGLCRMDRKGNIAVFTVDDGLQSNEFNAGAYCKSRDGWMLFGGINGINAFNPLTIRFNNHPPKVVLTGFKVFNRDKILSLPLSQIKDIRLNSDEDFFSFEFSALDFTAPEKNQYAYKLEGFDDDWIYAGNRRYASYTNLAPGDYIFKVRACNSDNVWNNAGVTVKLTIVPPFWRNKWFLILMLAIMVVLGAFALRYRIRRLQDQQRLLEQKVKVQSEKLKMERLKTEISISKALIEGQNSEQKRISEDLHDSLGQTLTAASLNLMSLEDDLQYHGHSTANEKLKNLKQLLQHAIVEVRNISHNLMPNLIAEEGLEEAVTELCARTITLSGLDIILKVQDLPRKMDSTLEISVYRIAQEVINNTLKHSGAHHLFISIIYRSNRILLETEDDGVGFDPNSKNSKGIGLKNIGIRVEMLNGAYHINSYPGRGTIISIEIPTNSDKA